MNVLGQCQKSHENDEHLKIIEDMDQIKTFYQHQQKRKMIFGRVMPLSGLTGVNLMTLLSSISIKCFPMKIKFSLSAWR